MAAILRRRPSLHWAAWFGLLTGFGEVVCLGVRKFLLHQPIYFGLHIVWMSPLANLLIFTFVWLSLGALRIASLRFKAGVMTFLGLLGCALVFEGLKFYAVALLAAWRRNREKATAQQNQADIDCYDGAIAYLDEQIGRLRDELERRGKLRRADIQTSHW